MAWRSAADVDDILGCCSRIKGFVARSSREKRMRCAPRSCDELLGTRHSGGQIRWRWLERGITCFSTTSSTGRLNCIITVISQVGTGDCRVKSACSTLAQVLRSSIFSFEKMSSLKLKPSIFVHSNCTIARLSDTLIFKKQNTHTSPIWGDLVLLARDHNKPPVLIHHAGLHL